MNNIYSVRIGLTEVDKVINLNHLVIILQTNISKVTFVVKYIIPPIYLGKISIVLHLLKALNTFWILLTRGHTAPILT